MAENKELIEQLLKEIDFKNLTTEEISGPNGLLKMFTKRILETALNAEMTDQLGYEKHQSKGQYSNSRNGKSRKKVISDSGEIDIEVPRDRNTEYEPKKIRKHQRRFEGFDDKILSMYSRGMTNRDIQGHLFEIYGVEVSADLISNVTDSVIETVREWQNRHLDKIYPIIYFDAIVVKGRSEGRVVNKSVYIAIGINKNGDKEVLGLWIGETEGAKFWMGIITELNNRGVKDILIACIDGLKGLPEAVNAIFPQTRIQLCIVHMVRNSTKYITIRERKEVCADLKKIYESSSEREGLEELDNFAEKWDKKYPSISKSWRTNWENLNEFFNYPAEIRKVIYTTNAIESLNSSLRKVTQKRSAFPTDDSIYKVLYLAISNVSKKWTRPIKDWGAALNQFAIYFGDRVPM
jgi:transposase-like protein